MEPEPTQNMSGQAPGKKVKINHFTVCGSGYNEPDLNGEFSANSRPSGPKK